MYRDTTVLKDADCPYEILSETAPTGVTYEVAKHACVMTDCAANCDVGAASSNIITK